MYPCHDARVVIPVLIDAVPAGHGLQELAPNLVFIVPEAHGLHASEPVVLYEPGQQDVH